MFSAPRKELNRFDFSLQKITAHCHWELSHSESKRVRERKKRESTKNSISRGNSTPFYSTPNCFRRAFRKSLFFNLSFAFISNDRLYQTYIHTYLQNVSFQDRKFFIEFGIEFFSARIFSLKGTFLFVIKDGNIRISLF